MYKVIENKVKYYKSTGGLDMKVYPSTKYSIYWIKGESELLVCDIKDHFENPKGIAGGICKSLNQGKVILPLNV